MAGEIVSVWSARDFDFSPLAAGVTKVFSYFPEIDLLAFRSATFLVRVHDVTITGDATLQLRVLAAAPSCEDPGTQFHYAEVPLAAVSVAAGTSGSLLRASLPPAFGAWVAVVFTVSQPVAGAETVQARLSGAFVGRR